MALALSALVVRTGNVICALPLSAVRETMRPLPIETLAGAPPFVLGVSVIRGRTLPVVALDRLLTDVDAETPTRFVTLATGTHDVVLSVGAVVGVRALPAQTVGELPPLLRRAKPDVLAAIGTLDAQLLLVLEAVQIVPDETWSVIERSVA
jgi:purine-binding chemotaxis protein CheW